MYHVISTIYQYVERRQSTNFIGLRSGVPMHGLLAAAVASLSLAISPQSLKESHLSPLGLRARLRAARKPSKRRRAKTFCGA